MKKHFLVTILCFFFSFSIVFSQEGLYYYGYKTKYPLKVDSVHAVIIPLSDKADENIKRLADNNQIADSTPIANRKEVLVTLNDRTLLNNETVVEGYVILPVYHVGTRSLRPTGEIIFQPKSGVDYNRIIELVGTHIQHLRSKKYGVHVVKPDKPHKLLEIANQIYESGLVEWCEPNFLIEIEKQQIVNPTDPLYPQQYYLNQSNNMDINAPQAWGITTGMCSVRVAVIDDGVEAHEDLVGRVVAGFTPLNSTGFGAPTVNLPPANEGIIGHGQACAGIIGASHNTLGIAGILPDAEIVPINIFYSWFLDPTSSVGQRLRWVETAENIADAINWAWDDGEAEVISNSWSYSTTNPGDIYESGQIIQAINNARTSGRGDLGSVVVFASGNYHQSFTGVAFPANVNGVITVGAIERNGNIWDYSSRGSQLDLVAPSGNTGGNGDLVTTDRMGALGYDTGNYFDGFGGTSAAAPQVAGVAALMLSANPNLTETQVRTILQNTAIDMGATGFDNTFGYGRLNAHAAVQAALPIITGPDDFCTSDTYTVSSLPTGHSVSSWSANPSGVTFSGSGSTVTVTRAGTFNGKVTLTATVTGSCGTYDISKEVQVGTPTPEITNIYVYPEYNQIDVLINTVPGATSYEYYIDGVLDGSTLGSSHVYSFYGVPCGYTYHLSVKAIGPCGPSWEDVDFAYLPCVSPFTVSPNPANGSLTVTAEGENAAAKGTGNQPADEFNVKLYNGQGRLLREADSMNGSVTLDTQELPEGTHYLHISRGKETVKRQVVIKH